MVIQPPTECADTESDKDSDIRYVEVQGDFGHLPRKVFRLHAKSCIIMIKIQIIIIIKLSEDT